MKRIVRTSLYLALICLVGGCASVKLLNTNQEFVTLMQQSAEARRLHREGTFDQYAYDAAMEGLRASFDANGDEATKAAEAAETDQSKASLLNVAARSYFQSGAVGEGKILAIADEGKKTCARMNDLGDLPTTCGYFHMVLPQAINDEWQRKINPIVERIDGLASEENLSVDEGKTLVRATEQFFAQLDALENAEGEIDFVNAGGNLRNSFSRQQDILFCNAQEAINSLDVVVPLGENWNRDDEKAAAEATESRHLQKLNGRTEGFGGC